MSNVSLDQARQLIEQTFLDALRDVDPGVAVENALRLEGDVLLVDDEVVSMSGRLILLAIGKAAAPMMQAAVGLVGDRYETAILLTKDGHIEGNVADVEVHEASHPIPDERGVNAARRILEAVDGLNADDVVVALVSGGGSALFEAPKAPITLDDMKETTRLLLRAGAPIQDLNAVRSELSEVKGGGLRRAIGPARCVSLILSDVLGNDPTVIASGPTVPREPNPAKARALLEKYGLMDHIPASVNTVLETATQAGGEAGRQTDNPGDASLDVYRIIGDNAALLAGMERRFREAGLDVTVPMRDVEGEASEVAGKFLIACIEADPSFDLVMGGGETTVTVRGEGIGGRNTEFALEAALELDATGANWVIASLASDGQDGLVDAAGAIVDAGTVNRAATLGIDARQALAENNSGGFFEGTGELVKPGPTGTNVNDVYVGLRVSKHGD